MTPAVEAWSELLDQLEADLDAIDAVGGDAYGLIELLAVGIGVVPGGPGMPMPPELRERAAAIHRRFGEVEARLEVSRRQVRIELEAAGPHPASIPRFIDAGF